MACTSSVLVATPAYSGKTLLQKKSCSAGVRDEEQSDTTVTLYPRSYAARPVESMHSDVTMPHTSTFSMPRARSVSSSDVFEKALKPTLPVTYCTRSPKASSSGIVSAPVVPALNAPDVFMA